MKPESVDFEGAEGNRLSSELWSAPADERAVAIFMHGGGQTRHAWQGAARRFARGGITSFAVDARGHGDSEWVPSRRYSMFDMAADLGRLVEQVRERTGEIPIVIGASMGGLATMLHCAGEGAAALRAVVLVDITPRMQQSGVDRILSFMAERAEEGFGSVEEAAEAIAAYLPNRPKPKSLDGLSKNLRRADDGRYRWHWDPSFVSGPHPVESREGPLRQQMLLDGVAAMNVPLLLVRGSRSELVTEAAVEEVRGLAPHLRYVDVGGAGHMVAGDRNDVFADAVLDFIERDVLTAP